MTKGQAKLARMLEPFGARKAIAERVGADPTLVTRWGQGRQNPTTVYRIRFVPLGIELMDWETPADSAFLVELATAEATATPPSAA